MDSSSTRNQSYEEYSLSSILNNLSQPPPPPLPPPPLTSSSSSSFFDPHPSYHPTFNNPIPSTNPNPNPTQPSSSSPPPPPRASKKRSRASRRAPTTILTTDTSNFRAMVQEFTGFPSPPFPPSSSTSFLARAAPSPSLLNINYPLSAMNIGSVGSGSRNPILAELLAPQFRQQEVKDADNEGDGGSGRWDKRLKGGWNFGSLDH